MTLNSRIPSGPLKDKWDRAKFSYHSVNPARRKKRDLIVVGAGLAGSSAAASLAEAGYNVQVFFLHDSARRAHSIAAQGGINAAKNYPNDGDSVFRLFYDTVKGGDFRAREANIYRLAQISNSIIDQCAAQGVPFAREYGGGPANRSFGGAQVSRTFYARGQTGQQLLLGAYGALMRQAGAGKVRLFPRHEMLQLVTAGKGGRAQGIVTRNLITGEIQAHRADAVLLCTGGYGNVYYLSTNAANSNVTAVWRCHKQGAFFAAPCFVQIHPTCIPQSGDHQSKLTLMSESLRNDGRVWTPLKKGDKRSPQNIPQEERDYYLERIYPSFGNLAPRDIASRQAKFQTDRGLGVGETGKAVYLDFAEAIQSSGEKIIREKYGNLFSMYERITGENPYKTPMRIFPAVHYTMGGLWADYNLQTSIPGLFALGEANFSDHGANRLGASALMQGLADGYFIIPAAIGNYLSEISGSSYEESAFKEAKEKALDRTAKLSGLKGTETVRHFHRRLGEILWDRAGMTRSKESLQKAIREIKALREEFWANALVPSAGEGGAGGKNQELEQAGRVADFMELAELIACDALQREESCGCHFRVEYQTKDHEALRNDKDFSYVSVWEWARSSTDESSGGAEPAPPPGPPGSADPAAPTSAQTRKEGSASDKWKLHKEPLVFEAVKPSERSYK